MARPQDWPGDSLAAAVAAVGGAHKLGFSAEEEPGRVVGDAQVRKLMEEMSKHGRIGLAALRADLHRNTAAGM